MRSGMDRSSLLAVIGALVVIVVLAIQGWWLFLAVLFVASLGFGYMGWRAGLPWFRAPDE